MTAAETRVRAERLASALADTDPNAVRAALHGLTPLQANQRRPGRRRGAGRPPPDRMTGTSIAVVNLAYSSRSRLR